MTVRALALAALALPLSSVLAAADPSVTIERPWARASIGTSRPVAAYATIRNDGDVPLALTGIEADVSEAASVHESAVDAAGIAQMRLVGMLEVPAGGSVTLEPGGYHVMLTELTRLLAEGESFAATFLFSDGMEIEVEVPVLGIGARGPQEPLEE